MKNRDRELLEYLDELDERMRDRWYYGYLIGTLIGFLLVCLCIAANASSVCR